MVFVIPIQISKIMSHFGVSAQSSNSLTVLATSLDLLNLTRLTVTLTIIAFEFRFATASAFLIFGFVQLDVACPGRPQLKHG